MTSLVAALQQALAAENSAVRVLAYCAARTSRSRLPEQAALLDEAYLAHRARRDAWEEWLRAQAASPSPAAPEYELPDTRDAGATVLALESACAEHYAALLAVSTGELRLQAATALESSALSQVRWGGRAVPFPGAPEL